MRDVVQADFPELLHLLPTVDELTLDKFDDGSVVMTDTCNTAKLLNDFVAKKIADATGKVIHSVLCFNHLRNVWVKNVLKAATAFLKDYLLDNLEEIAPSLRVATCMSGIVRAFDREFSLCANYPKGHGELFRQWMKEYHPGELLFHVERAQSGGRHDVVSMASLAMYWNRNYCIEFLDYMLSIERPNRDDSILVQNMFVILSSLEMIASTRMWCIFHLSIIVPCRWLAGNVHNLAKFNWGVADLGKTLDRLKVALEVIRDHPDRIHDEKFMMSIMWYWKKDLPPFEEYMTYMFEKKGKRTKYVVSPEVTGSKPVPLMAVRKEVFNPVDEDNIECTRFLHEIAVVAAEAWIKELLDPKKGTYRYMSDSNSPYCWKNVTEETKRHLMGVHATNDIAESSFAALTSQLESFGRGDLASLAGVSDLMQNGFMNRPTKRKDIKNNSRGMFHLMPEGIQLSFAKAAVMHAPETKKTNNIGLQRLHKAKRRKEELLKQAGLEKAREEYIRCLNYHFMWKSDRCWKTAEEVDDGLNNIRLLKDQRDALKDNIQIRYLGMGWNDCHTTFTKDGRNKPIEMLRDRLIEIIDMTSDRMIPDQLVPNSCSGKRKRKELPSLGHITAQVQYLYQKAADGISGFDLDCRKIWKERNENDKDGGICKRMQQPGEVTLDESHIGKRICLLSRFGDESSDDVDATTYWCKGTIDDVCDDGTSAWVTWDAIPEEDYPESTTCESFPPRMFNGEKVGSWMFDLSETIDYGLPSSE